MSSRGIGTDIVAVKRIQRLIERYGERFIRKVFTAAEDAYCSGKPASAPSYAGRFAAKEAISKAIYQAGHNSVIPLNHIEVLNDPEGRPLASVKLELDLEILVSISHENEYAVAMAMVEMK